MAITRTVHEEMQRRLNELEEAVSRLGVDQAALTQATELGRLRAELAAHDSQPMAPSHSPRTHSQLSVQPLRPPPIERFSGSREASRAFVRSVDNRLESTGQMGTLAGLEFATGHLTGYASSWWLCFSQLQPQIRSWLDLRAAFLKEFEMVDEQRVFESRLLALVQTASLEEYVNEFLTIAVRLTDQSDAFKQRCFMRGCCSYLKEKFADREFSSLPDMVQSALRLSALVPEHLFQPDTQAPVIAALSRDKGPNASNVTCNRCGRQGHKRQNCFAKRDARNRRLTDSAPAAPPKSNGQNRGPAQKKKANFGRYDGSGRVNAIETAESVVDSELSDDDLRQGNDEA